MSIISLHETAYCALLERRVGMPYMQGKVCLKYLKYIRNINQGWIPKKKEENLHQHQRGQSQPGSIPRLCQYDRLSCQWPLCWTGISGKERESGFTETSLCQKENQPFVRNWRIQTLQRKRGARLQSVDHTESYETCGCVCASSGKCGEIRIRVETNPHPYEGKYGLPGGREICVGQYLQYIHYARPRLFFLEGIKGTILFIIIVNSQQP